jgi:two-component sensor histidine kinase
VALSSGVCRAARGDEQEGHDLIDTAASASPDRLQRYHQILADFSRMVAEASDVPGLLRLATVQAARAVGIRHSKVMQYRPETGDLLIVAGIGWRDGVVGNATFGIDVGSAPGQTMQSRQPLIVYDLAFEPGLRNPPTLREHGIVSLLNVPIAVDGVVWGVLEVDSETPRHFGNDDAKFLVTMGNILGLALQARIAVQRTTQEAINAAAALSNQKVLLRELEHRFKNDLQLIQILLIMQARNLKDDNLRRDLHHVMDRVAAIGMAHDQLSASDAHGIVELSDYLRALCGNLGQRSEGIGIETDLARMRMPHERAVPLGLIVNELVTNAIKHAYPGKAGGIIRVTFATADNGEGVLYVRDDGVGMGPPREGSAGTDLLARLVQQIGGHLEQVGQEKGTGFCIRFPLVT